MLPGLRQLDLAGKTGDKVIALQVHEFAVGRFGRVQLDCPAEEGKRLVADVVADLSAAGISAESEIGEAYLGHIARTSSARTPRRTCQTSPSEPWPAGSCICPPARL